MHKSACFLVLCYVLWHFQFYFFSLQQYYYSWVTKQSMVNADAGEEPGVVAADKRSLWTCSTGTFQWIFSPQWKHYQQTFLHLFLVISQANVLCVTRISPHGHPSVSLPSGFYLLVCHGFWETSCPRKILFTVSASVYTCLGLFWGARQTAWKACFFQAPLLWNLHLHIGLVSLLWKTIAKNLTELVWWSAL